MPSLLLLTVGTGTAGRYSNLAAGLARTVELIAPRLLWLVPSLSEDSQTIAELVAESTSAFCPVSSTTRFHTIARPDDLECCRQTMRTAIAHARLQLRSGERLVVNPTSGTKQMSVGAAIAALDEGIGDIGFTVGERADGVVITGTERLTAFDPGAYLREHALAQARDLAAAGAFFAAARMIGPYRAALPRAHATAWVLHYWQRFDYRAAVSTAAGYREDLGAKLALRSQAVSTGEPSILVLSDLIAWAEFSRHHGDADACLGLAYKALEYAARLALRQRAGLTPNAGGCFDLAHLRALELAPPLLHRCESIARDDGVPLGLTLSLQLLQDLAHPLGQAFFDDRELRRLTQTRNEFVHDIRPISPTEAQAKLDRLRNVLAKGNIATEEVRLPVSLPTD